MCDFCQSFFDERAAPDHRRRCFKNIGAWQQLGLALHRLSVLSRGNMLRIFLRRDTCGFAAVAAALACRSHALCSANQHAEGKRDSGAGLVTQQAPEPWQVSRLKKCSSLPALSNARTSTEINVCWVRSKESFTAMRLVAMLQRGRPGH